MPHRADGGRAPRSRASLLRYLRYATGFAGLLGFLVIGNALADFAHVPLPGSVLGMVLLTLALHLGLLRSDWVAPAATLLIRHMGLLFVPPGVGLMVHFGLVERHWLPIGAGALASIGAVLIGVGLLQQHLERR